MVPILEACLTRGFKVLVLTNGMNTLLREKARLRPCISDLPGATLRISLDHYTPDIHALERGPVLETCHRVTQVAVGHRHPLRGRGADHVG